jgi:UDP-N-acetylmuramate: L-alanyl-gamma-D-glutamyl-meso-diaminopimelate ligase
MGQIHFIAMGGSVMHQLALALHAKGDHVSGSDDDIFEPARTNLAAAGLLPEKMGWFPEKIHSNLDAIILGMHARADNPELLRAQELQIPIYSFPAYMYQAAQDKLRVAIGGSHGKTTITSMVMHVLAQQQKAFDYLVGAKLAGFERSVSISDAPIIVFEADEYPASALEKRPKFHFLKPQVAVLSGIAWDHINVFPTYENYLEQFRIFLQTIEPGGTLLFNGTDPELVRLVAESGSHLKTRSYQVPPYSIVNGETILYPGTEKEQGLQVFGEHNLLNIQAAWLVCQTLGISEPDFLTAISTFKGAAKRMELVAKSDQTAIYRDFAHAPSKVKATIQALRQQYPNRKLLAVLELHTYSSLNEAFLDQYQGALDPADQAIVFYSAHALEIKRMPPLAESAIRQGFAREDVKVITDRPSLERFLEEQNFSNTNLLMMSSGDFEGIVFAELSTYLPA